MSIEEVAARSVPLAMVDPRGAISLVSDRPLLPHAARPCRRLHARGWCCARPYDRAGPADALDVEQTAVDRAGFDLMSVTPFGAYLGFLAAGIAARVAFRRRYSTAQRTIAGIALLVGLALAAFWWWISSYPFI